MKTKKNATIYARSAGFAIMTNPKIINAIQRKYIEILEKY